MAVTAQRTHEAAAASASPIAEARGPNISSGCDPAEAPPIAPVTLKFLSEIVALAAARPDLRRSIRRCLSQVNTLLG